MEQLVRNLRATADSLGNFHRSYSQVLEKFGAAHAELTRICSSTGEAAHVGVDVGALNGSEFQVEYCGLRLTVALLSAMTESGVARGVMEFREVAPAVSGPVPPPLHRITLDRTGTCSVRDRDGDPADVEYAMLPMVLQVLTERLQSRLPGQGGTP